MREWTTDEIIYIIYKNGGVAQLGSEAKFVDYYWGKLLETGELNATREELIEAFEIVNQHMLETIENYYAMGLSIADVLQAEAGEHGLTIEELLQPIFAPKSLH